MLQHAPLSDNGGFALSPSDSKRSTRVLAQRTSAPTEAFGNIPKSDNRTGAVTKTSEKIFTAQKTF
jgi:hypothetical protein